VKAELPRRILVATDGSATANEAVGWAVALASQNDAELVLVRVLSFEVASEAGSAEEVELDLAQLAMASAGPRGRAHVLVDDDPARAIVRVAVDEEPDLVVVGSAGMTGRKKFLLGNVPNRVSHLCPFSVVIVKTGKDTPTPNLEAGSALSARAQVHPYLTTRSRDLIRIIRKHRLNEALREGPGDAEARRSFAQHLRAALDEMGPAFAKIGQALSTRPDLLPPEFIEELATLQDHVSPLTEAQVVGVLETELGVPWEDVFESIDPKPLAAGTIAQVHRATLASGERVVVKVQRPNARVDIEQDLELLSAFARKAEKRAGITQLIDVAGVVDHLSTSLVRELDFRAEAASLTRMHDVLQAFPRLGVPTLYAELSTGRVLVMEEIEGLAIDAVPVGVARTEAARQLLESYFHQVIGVGFFHADPHPGNFVWRDDRLYFLDLGMVGEIDPPTRELLSLLLFALWRNDSGLLADVALMLAGGGPPVGPGFEKELGELLRRYHDAPLAEISLGVVLQEMTQTALRHSVKLPASLVLSSKAMGQMQLAVAELDPTLDPVAVAGSFVSRLMLQRLRQEMDPRKLISEFVRLRMRATRLMEALEHVTAAQPGPGNGINLGCTRDVEKAIHHAGWRIASGLVLAGALGAGALRTSIRASGTARRDASLYRSPRPRRDG
jgi:ubiquinone biosynthesis protein